MLEEKRQMILNNLQNFSEDFKGFSQEAREVIFGYYYNNYFSDVVAYKPKVRPNDWMEYSSLEEACRAYEINFDKDSYYFDEDSIINELHACTLNTTFLDNKHILVLDY